MGQWNKKKMEDVAFFFFENDLIFVTFLIYVEMIWFENSIVALIRNL